MHKTLIIFGTRPELIKLAPVIYEFEDRGLRDDLIVINTNQHNSLLRQIVENFSIDIDHTLDIINNSNNLSVLSADITKKLEELLIDLKKRHAISSIIVQGDTTSTYCASVVAFYNRIPVHYIEAGLRTYDNSRPFPEEFHRRVISFTAKYLYAPTESARKNLLDEGFDDNHIFMTGNTIIDSIQLMKKLSKDQVLDHDSNTVLCTIHRRENHGKNLLKYIESIVNLAIEHPEFKFVIIRHPNPEIKKILIRYSTKQTKNLIISDPVPYSTMLGLIEASQLIITDSGGLQEEASFFLKPVIVLRNSTERVESIDINNAVCVDELENGLGALFNKMIDLEIDESNKYIYGSGKASSLIVDNILN